MTYEEWNRKILEHVFFNKGGERVYLDLTSDDLNEIAGMKDVSGSTDLAIAVVKKHEDGVRAWGGVQNICSKARTNADQWTRNGCATPPSFLAYLALFTHAATVEVRDDENISNYYPRLNRLLAAVGYPRDVGTNDFHDVLPLWEKLQNWSLEKSETDNCGLFEIPARLPAANRYVHIPLRQGVISQRDRKALRALFSDEGMDSENLGENELATRIHSKFSSYWFHRIKKGTLAVNDENRKIIMEAIVEELDEWMESGCEDCPEGRRSEGPSTNRRWALELCAQIEQYSMRPEWRILSKSRAFRDEDESLYLVYDGNKYGFKHELEGLSGPIRLSERLLWPDIRLPSPGIPLTLQCEDSAENKIGNAMFSASDVICLEPRSGTEFYTRAHRVLPGTQYHALIRNGMQLPVGVTETPLNGLDGVPDGWRLSLITMPADTASWPTILPLFIKPADLRLQIVDGTGIRIGRMTYLSGYLPGVKVDPWPFKDLVVKLNNLEKQPGAGGFINFSSSKDSILVFTLLQGGNEVHRLTIYARELSGHEGRQIVLDPFGHSCENGDQQEQKSIPPYCWDKFKVRPLPSNAYYKFSLPCIIVEPKIEGLSSKASQGQLEENNLGWQVSGIDSGHCKVNVFWHGLEVGSIEFDVQLTPDIQLVMPKATISLPDDRPCYFLASIPQIRVKPEDSVEISVEADGQALSIGTDGIIDVSNLQKGDHDIKVLWRGHVIATSHFSIIERPKASIELHDADGNELATRLLLPAQRPTKIIVKIRHLDPAQMANSVKLAIDGEKQAVEADPEGTLECAVPLELENDKGHLISIRWRDLQIGCRRFLVTQADITYLGRAPGQVCRGDSPTGWDPIWIKIPKGKRYRLFFAGSDPVDAAVRPEAQPQGDKKAVKRWAKEIHGDRKLIDSLVDKDEAALWAKYLAEGENNA